MTVGLVLCFVFGLLGKKARRHVLTYDRIYRRRELYWSLWVAADDRIVGFVFNSYAESIKDAGIAPDVGAGGKL